MKRRDALSLGAAVALLGAQVGGRTAWSASTPAAPKRWRIAYVESQSFINYAATLVHLIRGLHEAGAMSSLEGMPWQPEQLDTRVLWDWLARHGASGRIEFVADAHYSFQGLKDAELTAAADVIALRLRERRDIDLVLAMGTAAGKTLANGAHTTPVLVFSTSNAVKAGIVKAVSDSGRDHVWAHMDPLRYRRQLEIFHDIFQFRSLGIAYENSTSGRTFAAVEDVEAVAGERGFQILREPVTQLANAVSKDAFHSTLAGACARLAERTDALYFGVFPGIDPSRLAGIFAPLVARKIPVFAQQAPDDVRYGALMSVARADFGGIGRFGAGVMMRVLQGKQPRALSQVYENSANIILNLSVARAIGYRPSFEILQAADEVFEHVETAPRGAGSKP